MMRHSMKTILFWCGVLVRVGICLEVQHIFETHEELNDDNNMEPDIMRGRRGVIEEEKFYNIKTHQQESNFNQPWIPGPLPPDENPTTKVSIANDGVDVLPLYQTTERVTDKPTGRGARASNENWIKLPLTGRDDLQRDQLQREQRGQRDSILTPPQPSGDLINSRMPRVNFVTQNKGLEASESRNDKDSIQRSQRTDDLRTEFVRPDDDRMKNKPVHTRQAVYNQPTPEESRRYFYDDRYYPAPDDLYRRDPYFDMVDRRRYYPYGPRIDRYEASNDNIIPRRPKRIIYYAHLPEVVRTPPNVDLRYRYSVDPYRRFDDDFALRNGRYDYRFRPRSPYGPLRKDDRNYRDLAGAGTVNKDKKIEDKVTPTPIMPQKDDKYKTSLSTNRDLLNSHQYHVTDSYNEPLSHKSYQDVMRHDDSYLRFNDALFHTSINGPY